MVLGGKKQKESLEQVSKTLEQANSLIDTNRQLQNNLKTQERQIQKQQDFLDQLAKKQNALADAFESELKILQSINKQAHSEVHNLKTAKIELKNSVTNTFNTQLAKAAKHMEETVATDTKHVEELSKKLTIFSNELQKNQATLLQFQDLAKTVKNADFELKSHIQALDKADKEKVHLMKRIDELETNIAKFKRGDMQPRENHRPQKRALF
jgi:chromosome segregation ATPase